jgi:hypothetical protein
VFLDCKTSCGPPNSSVGSAVEQTSTFANAFELLLRQACASVSGAQWAGQQETAIGNESVSDLDETVLPDRDLLLGSESEECGADDTTLQMCSEVAASLLGGLGVQENLNVMLPDSQILLQEGIVETSSSADSQIVSGRSLSPRRLLNTDVKGDFGAFSDVENSEQGKIVTSTVFPFRSRAVEEDSKTYFTQLDGSANHQQSKADSVAPSLAMEVGENLALEIKVKEVDAKTEDNNVGQVISQTKPNVESVKDETLVFVDDDVGAESVKSKNFQLDRVDHNLSGLVSKSHSELVSPISPTSEQVTADLLTFRRERSTDVHVSRQLGADVAHGATMIDVVNHRLIGDQVVGTEVHSALQSTEDLSFQSNIVQQIVKAAKVRLFETHADMTLRLEPPHLGTIRMNVAVEQGVVTAVLKTSTEAACRILEADLPMLKQSLAEAGIHVDRISVSVGDSFGLDWSASDGDSHNERPSGGFTGRSAGSSGFWVGPAVDAVAQNAIGPARLSQFDYLA